MSVMARDHVLRTSNSSSGFSFECDAARGSESVEDSSSASSFSGFSSSLKGGMAMAAAASSSSPLLRRSLMTSARGMPAIKVRLIQGDSVCCEYRFGHCVVGLILLEQLVI